MWILSFTFRKKAVKISHYKKRGVSSSIVMTVENDKVSFKFMFVLNEVLLATTIIVSEF